MLDPSDLHAIANALAPLQLPADIVFKIGEGQKLKSSGRQRRARRKRLARKAKGHQRSQGGGEGLNGSWEFEDKPKATRRCRQDQAAGRPGRPQRRQGGQARGCASDGVRSRGEKADRPLAGVQRSSLAAEAAPPQRLRWPAPPHATHARK